MDARRMVWMLTICVPLFASEGYGQVMSRGPQQVARARTTNFIVTSRTQQFADQVAQAAEDFRRDLAVYWLGQELPDWPQPCPIQVIAADNLGAGGQTTFTLIHGTVRDWRMMVQGTPQRILDSVLPHEITHTVLATHFAPLGKPVPRWADEGACTTVEHQAERSKHERMLVEFLQSGRGIPFAAMFTMRDYPSDIMPLYAQGYSVAAFLIAQGGEIDGPQRFVSFLEEGMRSEDWVTALNNVYGYPRVGKLQSAWNQWVGDGGGEIHAYTAVALGFTSQPLNGTRLASATMTSNQPTRMSSSNTQVAMAQPSTSQAQWRNVLGAPVSPDSSREPIRIPIVAGNEGETAPMSTSLSFPVPSSFSDGPADSAATLSAPPNNSPDISPPFQPRSMTGDYVPWAGGGSSSVR